MGAQSIFYSKCGPVVDTQGTFENLQVPTETFHRKTQVEVLLAHFGSAFNTRTTYLVSLSMQKRYSHIFCKIYMVCENNGMLSHVSAAWDPMIDNVKDMGFDIPSVDRSLP